MARNDRTTEREACARDFIARVNARNVINKTEWTLDDSDVVSLTLDKDLRRWLVALLASPNYKPPVLPKVAMEVHALTQERNITINAIARVLRMDPVLAGRVMKVVQSPLYAGRTQVTSLAHALTRLGLDEVRNIVWQVGMDMKVFRSTHYADMMEAIRRHSIACAHIAGLVAKQARVVEDMAFLAGLMHDVGNAGALLALGEQKNTKPPDKDALWRALDEIHEDASALMVAHWTLPDSIRQAAGNHHSANPNQGTLPPLLAVVIVAELLANNLDYGAVKRSALPPGARQDNVPTPLMSKACESLRIDAATLATLRDESAALLARAEPL